MSMKSRSPPRSLSPLLTRPSPSPIKSSLHPLQQSSSALLQPIEKMMLSPITVVSHPLASSSSAPVLNFTMEEEVELRQLLSCKSLTPMTVDEQHSLNSLSLLEQQSTSSFESSTKLLKIKKLSPIRVTLKPTHLHDASSLSLSLSLPPRELDKERWLNPTIQPSSSFTLPNKPQRSNMLSPIYNNERLSKKKIKNLSHIINKADHDDDDAHNITLSSSSSSTLQQLNSKDVLVVKRLVQVV